MSEICYARGKKIVLLPEQNRQGTWFCRFMIPGVVEANPREAGETPCDGYKSEWDAKTAAFESAKRVLDSINKEDASDGIPGEYHGPHLTQKTASATNATGTATGQSSAT